MDTIICTFNVKVLQQKKTRSQLFKWLEESNFSVCFIQETHIAYLLNKNFKIYLDRPCYVSGSKTNKERVAILINKNSWINVNNFTEIINGRLIRLYLTIQDKEILFINIYGPNFDQDKHLFDTLKELLSKYRPNYHYRRRLLYSLKNADLDKLKNTAKPIQIRDVDR